MDGMERTLAAILALPLLFGCEASEENTSAYGTRYEEAERNAPDVQGDPAVWAGAMCSGESTESS
ncbi:hypothetical protein NOK12_33950 [Nocardioides sp. OK12]|nr:hypothetical protein NOK12_33950 [Nocardioides sp. OK12]